MPDKTINDLPENIKKHLPVHAQSIFLKAFNNALNEYNDENIAFKVAWSSVKKSYKKDSNEIWIKK